MSWFWIALIVCVLVGAWVMLGAAERGIEGVIARALRLAGAGEGAAKWARGVLAVVIVGAAVAWWPGGDNAAEKGAGQIMPAVMVSTAAPAGTEAAEKMPDALACPCDSGMWCTDPRGGVYCVTIDGKKRYRK